MAQSDQRQDANANLFNVNVMRGVRIPLSDGRETLSADLFLPHTSNPVPALISVLPYRNDAGSGVLCEATLKWFACRGIATLLVDLRGTGLSDGAQRPPFDVGEGDDAIAAIAWAANQAWCNSNVGMWGISYGAMIAMRAATRNPPHLKAIMPIMGMTDPEQDFVHPNGARGCLGPAFWATHTLCNQLLPPLEHVADGEELGRWSLRLRSEEPWVLDLWRHGPGHPVWRERAIDAARITIPCFAISGWRDLFCDSQLRAFEHARGPKRLMVGPWMHTLPNYSPFDAVEYRTEALRWWNFWLKGEQNGIMREPTATVYIQQSSKPWRLLPSWPPKNARMHFIARGGEAPLKLVSDNACDDACRDTALGCLSSEQTVGTLSGLGFYPSSGGFGRPVDQHDDDMKILYATTEPIDREQVILGWPAVDVTWDEMCACTLVVAKLMDVTPEGRSYLISTGTVARSAPTKSTRVPLGVTSYYLPAGHRLRVTLSDADFPRLWPVERNIRSFAKVSSLTIELPVVESDVGEVFEAVVAGAGERKEEELVLEFRPTWRIYRDLLKSGVQVDVGQRVSAITPNRKYLLERNDQTVATMTPGASLPVIVKGASGINIRGGVDQHVVVSASVVMTGSTLSMVGRVVVGDDILFARQWDG